MEKISAYKITTEYQKAKEIASILGSSLALILTSPLIVTSMSLIAIIDKQNPLFLQKRISGDKEITILKLRTMKGDKVTEL